MIMDLVIRAREMIEEEQAVVVVAVVAIIIDKGNVIVIKMMIIDRTVESIDLVIRVDTVIHGRLPLKIFLVFICL